MFWIVGAEDIVHALGKISQRGPVKFLSNQLEHKAWEGVAFYDLIFPLFVYIVGVSMVFSLSRSLRTAGRAATMRRILKRSILLLLIGILYYGGLSAGLDQVRLLGVLQRIALCYLFASLIFCVAKPRAMVAVCVTPADRLLDVDDLRARAGARRRQLRRRRQPCQLRRQPLFAFQKVGWRS